LKQHYKTKKHQDNCATEAETKFCEKCNVKVGVNSWGQHINTKKHQVQSLLPTWESLWNEALQSLEKR